MHWGENVSRATCPRTGRLLEEDASKNREKEAIAAPRYLLRETRRNFLWSFTDRARVV